eukprot:CAMPEP_0173393062 /NCGR_PEP_ID=MMETSP1356-20130122/21885_1 /TAXON_ID=77927 ORGANISM="Hemiselmis virescens, Strain PCC157" /NCGR_SAMPLE_ID=MMETSP1356 /ASSEMBLY_ACC=CAM_ASM_000847 /LENGTH=679 /DNA_ID=CAMNT_0014351015 /DNA_START=168 /DNA_END=2207 /DNA_ORIENTATION=+
MRGRVAALALMSGFLLFLALCSRWETSHGWFAARHPSRVGDVANKVGIESAGISRSSASVAHSSMLFSVVTQPPSVSIVVPCLGGDILSGRVDSLLQSVGQQTMLPNELIVALSDSDERMCSGLLRAARIHLPATVSFRMNCSYPRMNQADARNVGAWLATGDLLMFHDADDTMHLQKVEMMTTLFHQKPRLQVFAHSFTRSRPVFAKPLVASTREASLHPFLSVADSLHLGGAKSFWGDMLRDAARAYAGCTKRCWIVNGMVPGASTARKRVIQQVPFQCSRAVNTGKRSDGACLAEDSLWFRSVLERFGGNDETLYMDLALIFYVPSGFWKRPSTLNNSSEPVIENNSARINGALDNFLTGKQKHAGSFNASVTVGKPSALASPLPKSFHNGGPALKDAQRVGHTAASMMPTDQNPGSFQSSARKWMRPDRLPPSHIRTTVAKRIHFVWTSPYLTGKSEVSVPREYLARFQRWAVLNPEWDVRVWTDNLVVSLLDEIVPLLRNISTPSWTSDILRWTILERYGGVYLDADVDPVRNLNILFEYFGPFVVCDTESLESNIDLESCNTRVANAIVGLPASHRLVYEIFIKVVEASWVRVLQGKLKYNVAISGPEAFSDAAKALQNVTFLGRQTFQPCWGKGRQKQLCTQTDFSKRSDVFGMHLFKFSWKNDRALGEKGA